MVVGQPVGVSIGRSDVLDHAEREDEVDPAICEWQTQPTGVDDEHAPCIEPLAQPVGMEARQVDTVGIEAVGGKRLHHGADPAADVQDRTRALRTGQRHQIRRCLGSVDICLRSRVLVGCGVGRFLQLTSEKAAITPNPLTHAAFIDFG